MVEYKVDTPVKKNKKKKQKRSGATDLCRFGFMLLIMTHHLYYIGGGKGFPYYASWIFVEFFFLLTGYFTMRHFSKFDITDNKIVGKTCLKYTLKKFKKMAPYIIVAVLSEYLADSMPYLLSHQWQKAIANFLNMPIEMMLLSTAEVGRTSLAPVWYLSAMFITLPLLCLLILKCKSVFSCILSWLIPLIYYGRFTACGIRSWPHDLLRAFSCMALGCFVFVVTDRLTKINFGVVKKIFSTLLELACFAGAIYLIKENLYLEEAYLGNFVMLLFVVGCSFMLSGKTFTSLLHGKFFDLLGGISLPMFLFHWTIGTWLNFATESYAIKKPLYYGLTIAISLVFYLIIEFIKYIRHKPKEKKALPQE